MLRQLPVILLVIGFLGQTFSQCLILLDYQISRNYIAANLCENRDKPAMKCQGKCYLCKRLKNENKKDQDNPERRTENKFESIAFQRGFAMTHPSPIIIAVHFPAFQETAYNSFTPDFFHPPQC